MENNSKKNKRQLKGMVVSDKMDKTVVVEIKRLKAHPLYKKRYFFSKRLKAHDPEGKAKEGDVVIIEENRPLSREKRWRIKVIL